MTPPAAVRIRAFRISDHPQVRVLWEKSEGVGLNESDTREAVGRYLKRNPGMSLVATAGRRVVAAVLCGHDGRRGYLHHLAVARRWRRRGLGRLLVDRCLASLAAEGIDKCNLFLFSDNAEGKAFWRRIGWSVRADLRLVQRATSGGGSCRKSC